MHHKPFTKFSLFVFRIFVAIATATSAVATTTPTVVTALSTFSMAVASTPGTEGGYQFGDFRRLRYALLFERDDQRVAMVGGGGGGDDFGGWRGGGRSGDSGDTSVQLVLVCRILALK